MFPASAILPPSTDRNFKRPHVWCHIKAGQIERQQRDALVHISISWRRKISVPRLVLGTLKWHGKPNLHYFKLGATQSVGIAFGANSSARTRALKSAWLQIAATFHRAVR